MKRDLFKKKKIKTMNIKKATNSQLSTPESKTKQNKTKLNKLANIQNRDRIIGMGVIWRVMSWEGEEGEWG